MQSRSNLPCSPDKLHLDLELRGELQKVSDEPEEVGLVHLKVRVLQQLLAQGLDEGGVALEEEVHRELLEQVGDVLLGGDVVDEGLHLDVVDKERLIRGSEKKWARAAGAREMGESSWELTIVRKSRSVHEQFP